jgi:hypothetical protein
MSTFEDVRKIALAIPGLAESTSYGTPAFKLKKRLLLRMKEDGETMVAIVGFDNRDLLLAAEPKIFFTTPHYAGYPTVLVRLKKISAAKLRDIVNMTVAHRK